MKNKMPNLKHTTWIIILNIYDLNTWIKDKDWQIELKSMPHYIALTINSIKI